MKTIRLLALTLLCAVTCPAQTEPPSLPQPVRLPSRSLLPSSPMATNDKEAVNYVIRVMWKQVKGETNSLQVLTTEGGFSLDTVQPGKVKINNSEVPSTMKLSGTLNLLSPEKGRLKLFLGRTVPYVTGTFTGAGGASSSSYQQLSVGLDSTFIVTFGKTVVIQSDGNEDVSILVKREEN